MTLHVGIYKCRNRIRANAITDIVHTPLKDLAFISLSLFRLSIHFNGLRVCNICQLPFISIGWSNLTSNAAWHVIKKNNGENSTFFNFLTPHTPYS